ncbi:unnamed protein product [Rhizophagus irregularis]|nr:unnamed protein product [Rhizophagus irregularis]
MMKFTIKEWAELISGLISMKEQDQRIFKHVDLPAVKDKLSITLLLKIHKHFSDWSTVFHKDGEWAGFYCIEKVKTHKAVFNDGPLHIGCAIRHNGFNGEISNVRYFNWRLSPEENESRRKPIVYGSKIALIHLSTGKYLSTKGVKYDFGPNNQQYMVICSDQEIDSENDVWTLVEANGKGINEGDPVSLNNIIGFKHKSTGYCLHSHNTNNGKVTPISKQQQVTLRPDEIGVDDEWLIRRYNLTTMTLVI